MLKPAILKATYSIEISRDLYEEIRINETRFSYSSGDGGEITLEGKHLLNICFHDERYSGRNLSQPLEIGHPEKSKNGGSTITIYGMHSFSELLKGIESAVHKALLCDHEPAEGGDLKKIIMDLLYDEK